MIVKIQEDYNKIKKAADISLSIMREMADNLKEGVTPLEIDTLAGQLCEKNNVKPAFKGVGDLRNPYEYNSCIALNDEILHSTPKNIPLVYGDLVKLDFGVNYEGYFTDHCYTFVIGGYRNDEDERLLNTGKLAVESAVALAISGNTTGDLGFTMQSITELAGFNVLKNYVGHGIGRSLHEPPEIPAWGKKGHGKQLKEGMLICIEAQIVANSPDTFIDKSDNWTVKTKDLSRGVMFEYLVIVRQNKPEILTPMANWDVIRG